MMADSIDLFITRATIVPMSPVGDILEDGAVAVQGDRLVAVGRSAEVERQYAGRAQRWLDARGGVLLPGLVNAHAHCHSTLTRGTAEDLPLAIWLRDYIEPEQRTLDDEDVTWAALLTYAESLLAGVTCILDLCHRPAAALRAARRLGIRATIAPNVRDRTGFGPTIEENEALLAENQPGARQRVWVGLHSIYHCSSKLMEALGRLAQDAGVGLHAHCAETAGEVEFTLEHFGQRPAPLLDSLGLLSPHTVLAHGVHLNASDVALLAARGAHVIHCPVANAKLASGIAPVADLLAAGVNVALGTDGAKANNSLDLLADLKIAALLQRVRTGRADALSARTALHLATTKGARALGLADLIGSIEVGRQADLVLYSPDGLHLQPRLDGPSSNRVSNLVFSASGRDVRTVLVAGQVLVDEGRLTTIDEQELREGAQRASERLLKKRA